MNSTARGQLQGQNEYKKISTNKQAAKNKKNKQKLNKLVLTVFKHKFLTITIMIIIKFILRVLANNTRLLQANTKIHKI
jgi:cell division protein FtsL